MSLTRFGKFGLLALASLIAPAKSSAGFPEGLTGTYYGEASYGTQFFYKLKLEGESGFSWTTLWNGYPKTVIQVANSGEKVDFEELAGCTKSAIVSELSGAPDPRGSVRVQIMEHCHWETGDAFPFRTEYFFRLDEKSDLVMEFQHYSYGRPSWKSLRVFKRVGKPVSSTTAQ